MQRFKALHIVSGLFKVAAWLSLAGGLLVAVLAIGGIGGSVQGALGAVLAAVPVAAFSFLILFAAAESIKLFLAIEDHLFRIAAASTPKPGQSPSAKLMAELLQEGSATRPTPSSSPP